MRISVEHEDFPPVPGCVRGEVLTYYFAQDSKDGLSTNFTYMNRYDMKGFFGKSSLQYYNLCGRVKQEVQQLANTLYDKDSSQLLSESTGQTLLSHSSANLTPDSSISKTSEEFK